MAMASFNSTIFTHTVPVTTSTHNNTPWTALKSSSNPPYLLTSDPFGAATHIWTINDQGPPQHVCSLDPPLPGGLVRVSLGLTLKPGLFVVAYDKPKDSAGVLRVYDTNQDGKMTHQTILPHDLALGSIDKSFKCSGEFVAVSLAGSEKIALVYKIQDDLSLKEVSYVTGPETTGVESLSIIHLGSDGTVLTGLPTGTNLHLSLHRAPRGEADPLHLSLAPVNSSCDYVDPSYVIPLSDSSLVLAVKESSSEEDHHPHAATSAIHYISLPSLSVTASIPFSHPVSRLTYNPTLGVVIALGARPGAQWTPVVTFLDPDTGAQKYSVELPPAAGTVRCTTEKLVVIKPTGLVSATPLKDVLAGQTLSEVHAVTTRPEPYNAKARKAGEDWAWVDHSIVSDHGVVLFTLRGPDIHFVSW